MKSLIRALGSAQVGVIGLACVIIGAVVVSMRSMAIDWPHADGYELQMPALSPNSGVSVKMNGVDPLQLVAIFTTAIHEVMLRQAEPGEC